MTRIQMQEHETNTSLCLAPVADRADFWQARVCPVFEKYFLALCLVLIGIACARIVSTYNSLSLTVDEPSHLACGMEYLAKHVYHIETQHPPLSRMMLALGPYLAGVRPLGLSAMGAEGVGEIASSGQINRTIFLMRLGTLPFFFLACLVVCAWSCHYFGKPIAVVAIALFTLLPVTLADSGLAITDMALGATVGAAFLAALYWAEKSTLPRSLLFGLSVGLACLSKFTALGYVPGTICLAFISSLAIEWPGLHGLVRSAVRRVPSFALAAITSGLVIWAGYWFSVGPFQTNLTPHWTNLMLPAPEFFDGIRSAFDHNRTGHLAFLFGSVRMTGWWYYFPIAFLLKTPIPFLILLSIGTFVCVRERRQVAYLFPLAFASGILLLAVKSRIDIGIRHVEPIYIALSIIAALGIRELLRRSGAGLAGVFTAGALLAWMTISVAIHHPDYLNYFNGLAGANPQDILVDSNYDWGQDLRFLAKHLRQDGVHEISLAELDGVYRADYLETWYGLPAITPVDPCIPRPGWTVIGATFDKMDRFNIYGIDMPKPWYEQISPTERFGPFTLYNISANTVTIDKNCHAARIR